MVMKSSAPNSTASAMVKVNDDGGVQLVIGAAEIGTGSQSVLAQICAEALGVPFAAVEVTQPDTAYSPYDRGAVSDRTTFHLGDAVYSAALMARQQLLEIAADKLEADAADLELSDGVIRVRGVPARYMSVQEAARRGQTTKAGPVIGHGRHLEEDIIPLDPETGASAKAASHYKFGAQAVEVVVDPETGELTVERVVSVHDCGRAINPLQVEGQIEGAVAQGMGFALLEEIQFDEGQVVNPSLMDYRVPTAPDVPEIIPIIVEDPYPTSPFGVKGVGEPGIIGIAPAIGNALHAATGVFLHDLPLTWERIHTALAAKE